MAFRRMALVLALLLAPFAAHAQYYGYPQTEKPGTFHLMAGLTQPVGNTSDILQSGWNIGGGVTFHQPSSPLAFRLDVDYASNNATNALINQGSADTGLRITGGWADTWSVTANLE